ncbi:hypothetical protein GF327_01470 [Candidatus Woesearchaeota archaeon]|nr:hypothetical protein [Candidatus Woesearchaeota archaeon]
MAKHNTLPQEYNYMLNESFQRLNELEDKFVSLEKKMNFSSDKWENKIDRFFAEISVIKKEIKELQDSFDKNIKCFLRLVNDFKSTATKEDLKRLENKIDEWDLEEFVSIEEFTRLCREHIQEQVSLEQA